MESTVLNQAYLLLVYLISGLLIGMIFDIFRVFRRTFKTSDFFTYIEDILFWIITGIFLIFVLFRFSSGEIRIYNILGLSIGFLFYIIFISKCFIKINVKILKFIKNILNKIIKIILYPIRFIFKIIRKIFTPFTFFVINIKKGYFKFIKKQKTKKKIKKNKEKNVLKEGF